MSTFYSIHDYYISHHGIKGQKWGVRRWRNEDGTLTEAGKKRYEKLLRKYTKEDEKGERHLKTAGLAAGEALDRLVIERALSKGARRHAMAGSKYRSQHVFAEQAGNKKAMRDATAGELKEAKLELAYNAALAAKKIGDIKEISNLRFLNKYADAYGGKSLSALKKESSNYLKVKVGLEAVDVAKSVGRRLGIRIGRR